MTQVIERHFRHTKTALPLYRCAILAVLPAAIVRDVRRTCHLERPNLERTKLRRTKIVTFWMHLIARKFKMVEQHSSAKLEIYQNCKTHTQIAADLKLFRKDYPLPREFYSHKSVVVPYSSYGSSLKTSFSSPPFSSNSFAGQLRLSGGLCGRRIHLKLPNFCLKIWKFENRQISTSKATVFWMGRSDSRMTFAFTKWNFEVAF